ncbi:MAG TPA: acyl-CoA dehydrogenase family protein [Novosphingobium sp.]|nr:acyl-CoA dehydrogenase family protein [Novosphingobium sp.]
MATELSQEERDLLVRSLRGSLEADWPIEHAVAGANDPDALRQITKSLHEMGLNELCTGDAPGLQETMLVFEELGRASCPAPLIGAILVNLLLEDSSDPVIQGFVASVREGRAIPAVALAKFDGDRNSGAVALDGGKVIGRAAFVEGAAAADHFLVMTSDPIGLAIVGRDADGLSVTLAPGLAVPPLSEVEFSCTPLAWRSANAERLADAASIVRLAALARAYGSARRAFGLALEHAKVRRQFGHVIGEFQAIQHKLANCLTSLDGTQSAIAASAGAYDRGDAGWRILSEAAIAYAAPALRQLLLEVHHTLGAIGYAEEHEVPRHFRSVHADLVRFGGAARARGALAGHLLAPAPDGDPEPKLPSHDTDKHVVEFRDTIRRWLAENWTDEDRAANRGGPFRDRRWKPEFSRKMGAAGLLGLDWPKAMGGQARSAGEQLAFIEEMEFAEAPTDSHMTAETIVGPAVIRHGSESQKNTFLPAFLRGERTFALHYSEPEAGSDLASLRTAARRDGDGWVISGQKMWSTYGDRAEYAILAARTDPSAKPKHAGISVFLVPLDTPGISIRPSMAMYGRTFSTTFYDDVRLPGDALLGEENGGWKVITSALAAERVMIGNTVAHLQHLFYRLTGYVRSNGEAAGCLDPVIRDRIGGLAAEIEIARQFTLRNAALVQAGRVPIHEAAMSKVFVGELQERLCEAALDVLGSGGLLSEAAPNAPLGEVEQELRHSLMGVLGGGTSEMQRNTIALRGLELPRMA